VAYNFSIKAFEARPWDTTLEGCRSQPNTVLLGYNGISPGHTVIAAV
jgi:hypothetical protein